MPRGFLKLILIDALLLILAYLVLQDLQWRVAYASSAHANTQGYSPSFSYGILMQMFTMSGGPITLASPPTLDWLQLIAIAFVGLNGLYFLRARARRNEGEGQTPPAANPAPS